MTVLALSKVIERLLGEGQLGFSLVQECFVSVLEGTVRLKEVQEEDESEEDMEEEDDDEESNPDESDDEVCDCFNFVIDDDNVSLFHILISIVFP